MFLKLFKNKSVLLNTSFRKLTFLVAFHYSILPCAQKYPTYPKKHWFKQTAIRTKGIPKSWPKNNQYESVWMKIVILLEHKYLFQWTFTFIEGACFLNNTDAQLRKMIFTKKNVFKLKKKIGRNETFSKFKSFSHFKRKYLVNNEWVAGYKITLSGP